MSKATAVFEGFISEPRSAVTKGGKPVLTVSVGHTPRKKEGDQWVDAGPTVWARASFFDEQADHLHGVLSKGDFVRVEGEPRLNVYTDRDGAAQASIDLWRPSLSIVPRAPRGGGSGGGWAQGAGVGSSGAQNAPQGGFGDPGEFGSPEPF